ncbi:CD99 molecule isoform X2 [Brachionichthys hirsutus]|uniref:CD99 molecule isoform X2 n=1 Tax=Brachionichthys hirsutus TaxID=412623 RepID=UPI00360500AA
MKFCLLCVSLLAFAAGTLAEDGMGFDLAAAFDEDPTPKPKEKQQPKADDGTGFDLSDALGPDETNKLDPKQPDVPPKRRGGGGNTFGDSDLVDLAGGDANNDGDRHAGGGGRDPGYDPRGGAGEEPQDPTLLWGQILKTLNANVPEEVRAWLFNLKQTLVPLLERALDALRAAP